MRRHPNKDIRAAVDYMLAAGWRVEMAGGHAWGRAYCPGERDGCRPPTSIWSTPRAPAAHARRLRRLVDTCPHRLDVSGDEGKRV
ncbi:MAG: hypothetical protein GEV04_13195 [Actinophytocola sp.]|nr:hypothetical protein [Actinophytocola sp.]